MRKELILFHSPQGLRPPGYSVHGPDLFDGEVFERLEDGVAKRDRLGIPEMIRRTEESVALIDPDVVYLGFSMGAASAEHLAAVKPGARGLVLMHGALPPAMLGIERWPAVPVQVHHAERDPWVESAAVTALEQAARAAGVRAEVHVYPGAGHLFADPDSPDYDAESAEL